MGRIIILKNRSLESQKSGCYRQVAVVGMNVSGGSTVCHFCFHFM